MIFVLFQVRREFYLVLAYFLEFANVVLESAFRH